MYGKNVNAYLVSHPTLHHLNGGEFLLHHHHDLLSGNNNNNYLAATIAAASNAPTILESTALFSNQEIGGGGPVGTGIILNGEYTSTAAPPPPAKKDRHSKIQTSQGPRDRRVRLSISIARKFFDLQEMLGFDKPSKTLDWLLTKSKAAIKDLVQTKKTAGTSCSEPDVGSQENGSKRKSSASPALNLAKESRVRARARARERTREKMCMKKINEAINHTGFGLGPRPENNSPIQYLHNNHFFEANYEEAEAAAGDDHHQDLIQGTNILIKRRIKNPSILGFQPNYSTPFPSENWDISSFNSYSNISAIFDQHKFMNSNSNDN